MNITFKLAEHSVLPDRQVVEVRFDDAVVATITVPPDQPNAISIQSAHIASVIHADFRHREPPIPAVVVRFVPHQYVIHGDQIVRVTPEEVAAKKIKLEV